MKNTFIFILFVFITYLLYNKFKKIKNQTEYLKEVGINDTIINKMSLQEINDSFIYLNNYAANNKQLTESDNKKLFDNIKNISSKYKIFSL